MGSLALAGHLRVPDLTLIVDSNGLQGLGLCDEVLALDPLTAKLEAFGFAVHEVPGHDHDQLAGALSRAATAPGR